MLTKGRAGTRKVTAITGTGMAPPGGSARGPLAAALGLGGRHHGKGGDGSESSADANGSFRQRSGSSVCARR